MVVVGFLVQFSLPGVRVSVQTNLCFEVRFVVVVVVLFFVCFFWGGRLLLS